MWKAKIAKVKRIKIGFSVFFKYFTMTPVTHAHDACDVSFIRDFTFTTDFWRENL
jgi:hypothetical protein